jgi:hypothetical protein
MHYSLYKPTNQGDKMKFFKRANLYKASNVTFNPDTCEARSYEWWAFTKTINGVLVFNDHRYSVSTAKHQSKVRALLRDLGHDIGLVVDARCGLQNDEWKSQAVDSISHEIESIKLALASTRRKKALDQSRLERLNTLTKEKQELEDFIASIA